MPMPGPLAGALPDAVRPDRAGKLPGRRVSARRRKGWLLRLFLPGLVFALFMGAALIASAPFVGSYVIERVVVPRLAARYHIELRLAEAKVRPTRVLLRGIIVRVPDRVDPFTAPRAEVKFALWPLLKGRIELTEVSLDRPLIQIVRGGDDDNVSSILEQLREKTDLPAQPGRRVWLYGPQAIVVHAAEVDVHDDAGVVHIASVDARVERHGESQATLLDSVAEIAGGVRAKAERAEVRWHSAERFLPARLPEIAIFGGALVPWRRLAMTGISGTIHPDGEDLGRAVIDLAGGYGGVDRQLWQAHGWVRPDGSGGLLHQRGAEAAVSVDAQRFRLSSLEPILKDTPIIDADKTEVDAHLELRFAQRALDFSGSFHMAGLSVFTPRLVDEPLRDLGIDLSARGRVDLKSRRFHIEKVEVRWNGAVADLEAEAEAQPAAAYRQPAAADRLPAGAGPAGLAMPSWREKWRTVYLHVSVPPIACQALLDSFPPAIVPRIRDFRLAGTFSTDVKVWVDFAKLMKLPPPIDPNNPDSPLTAEEEVNELAAMLPPAAVAAAKSRTQRPGNGQVNGNAGVKDPKDDPVQLSGRVGIDGCKVLEAPKDMNAARLLEPFEHTVLVEGDRELRFIIGPENPDFVPFEEISPYIINSIMTTEDNGFLHHRGFIVPEFRSALQSNLERGYFRLGASSVTMQMVKNVLLSREKTLSRKLQELFLTWYLENNLTDDADMLKAVSKGMSPNQYWQKKLQKTAAEQPATMASTLTPGEASLLGVTEPVVTAAQAYNPLRDINPIKRRILEIYFNAIEFGPYLYGIGKATRHYFGKAPKDLTPREAVWFSSILPNPKRRYIHYCKGAPDERWEKYLDRILRRLHERGGITDEEYEAALQQRLVFDRTEALPEKDCLALIQRLTEPPPPAPATPSDQQPSPAAQPAVKLPPPPPWAEADVHPASKHHGGSK
jgi:hypothetical protein